MLMSVTACAPVVYDATHYKHRTTTHVIVRSTHSQPSRHHEPVYHQVPSIEVTLYAGNTYLGVNFQSIQIVIADGEYVGIPIRNKRGRQTIIYAHYHQRNLHFDSDRNCRNLRGSSRYKYDKRWDKGRKYTYINAGKDYDLTGLQIRVRNLPTGKHQTKRNTLTKVVNQKVIVLKNNNKKPVKQQVTKVLLKSTVKQVTVHNQQRSIARRPEKVSNYHAQDKQRSKAKILTTKDRSVAKDVKNVKRPIIVERISRHDQLKHVRNLPQKHASKSDDKIHKRVKKQTGESKEKEKNQSTKADRKADARNMKSRSVKK
jgi:hypothetical protein